jgi:hypothetical protein
LSYKDELKIFYKKILHRPGNAKVVIPIMAAGGLGGIITGTEIYGRTIQDAVETGRNGGRGISGGLPYPRKGGLGN